MRVAVAEIGSRTVRYLAAEIGNGRLTQLSSASRPISLGRAVAAGSDMVQPVLRQLKDVVTEFRADAKRQGAERFACYGTEALRTLARDDRGSIAIIDPNLEVLSQQGEAECAFIAGVTDDAIETKGGLQYVVIDMGGGSIEVVAGHLRKTEPTSTAHLSVPLGSARISKQLADLDCDLTRFGSWLDQQLAAVDMPEPGVGAKTILLGSVPTKVAWLHVRPSPLDVYKAKAIAGAALQRDTMGRLALEILSAWKRDPAATRPLVDPRIKDDSEVMLVVSGLALLHAILTRQQRQNCVVSSRGARFGYAFRLAQSAAS